MRRVRRPRRPQAPGSCARPLVAPRVARASIARTVPCETCAAAAISRWENPSRPARLMGCSYPLSAWCVRLAARGMHERLVARNPCRSSSAQSRRPNVRTRPARSLRSRCCNLLTAARERSHVTARCLLLFSALRVSEPCAADVEKTSAGNRTSGSCACWTRTPGRRMWTCR